MPDFQVLAMRGISKAFPGVQALDSVDFAAKCRRGDGAGR